MKSFIIAMSILVTLISGIITINIILKKEIHKIDSSVVKLEIAIEKEEWEEAAKHLYSIEEELTKSSLMFHLLIDHQEVDNIEIHIKMCKDYSSSKQKADALSELSQVSYHLHHIGHKNKLTLANIF